MPYQKFKRRLIVMKYFGYILLLYGGIKSFITMISVGEDYSIGLIIAGLCLAACSSFILQFLEELQHEQELLKEEIKSLRRRTEP